MMNEKTGWLWLENMMKSSLTLEIYWSMLSLMIPTRALSDCLLTSDTGVAQAQSITGYNNIQTTRTM
jgi:hypothetical protein